MINIQEIYTIATGLFPGTVNLIDSEAPDFIAFEITKLPAQNKGYVPQTVEVYLQKDANFMLIDDFRWEFDNDTERAEHTIGEYLKALSEGRVQKKGIRFLNESLGIVEPYTITGDLG